MKPTLIRILFTGIIFLGSFHYASAGVGTRGGGNLAASNAKSLTEWLKSGQFNVVVMSYAKKIDSSKATDPEATKVWDWMMANGLMDDISNSKYIPSGACLIGEDAKYNMAASAVIGEKDGDICINVNQVVDQRTTAASLITLALHEHTHHLGYGELQAYLITSMVGAQLNSMDIAGSDPIANKVNPTKQDHLLASSIKKGSKIKLVQNLDTVQGPMFQNGHVFSGFGDINAGVFCWLQNGMRPGATYKVLNANAGFSDVRTPNVTSTDVSFWLDPGTAILTCERRPDQGAQLTVQEIHQALDSVFELNLKF
jgi:hypothetical protein